MAKKFACVSFGILCLVAAYQLGAERAAAEWTTDGHIVGLYRVGGGGTVWASSGEAWHYTTGETWQRFEQYDLPVPTSEIKMLTNNPSGGIAFVTTSDEMWYGPGPPWRNAGTPPIEPVATERDSWSGIKGRFR